MAPSVVVHYALASEIKRELTYIYRPARRLLAVIGVLDEVAVGEVVLDLHLFCRRA